MTLEEIGDREDEAESIEQRSDESDGAQMEFEDTVVLETTKDELWTFISDPKNLAECVPGAKEVTQRSKRKYSCEIERGISRLTISISGDVELVELSEPDWVVADGNAYDSTTGSEFDILAAMEMRDVDDRAVELSYTAELWFTGGVATLTGGIVRSLVNSDIETYFDNIKREVEEVSET